MEYTRGLFLYPSALEIRSSYGGLLYLACCQVYQGWFYVLRDLLLRDLPLRDRLLRDLLLRDLLLRDLLLRDLLLRDLPPGQSPNRRKAGPFGSAGPGPPRGSTYWGISSVTAISGDDMDRACDAGGDPTPRGDCGGVAGAQGLSGPGTSMKSLGSLSASMWNSGAPMLCAAAAAKVRSSRSLCGLFLFAFRTPLDGPLGRSESALKPGIIYIAEEKSPAPGRAKRTASQTTAHDSVEAIRVGVRLRVYGQDDAVGGE